MTLEKMFQSLHLPVFRYLSRMTGSADLAEELTQDVFVRAARALPTYRSQGKEAAWMFRIARNVLHNSRRDAGRRPESRSQPADDALTGRTLEPIRRIELDEALSRLADAERDAFLLRELGGLGYADIAGLCATTPAAVRSRIHRARSALREMLTKDTPRLPRRGRS